MAAHVGYIKSFVNEGINTVASVGYPSITGAVVGRFLNVGAPVGLLHGLTLGLYYEFIHLPLEQYLNANRGEGRGQIREQTWVFLNTTMAVALFVIPFLTAAYFGGAFAGLLGQYAMTQWLVTSSPYGYGVIAGFLVYFFAGLSLQAVPER